jgi:hypothetical protein
MIEIQKTGFVIKASAAGQVLWVGPFVAGRRALGDLARAEVFTFKADANAAIGEIPLAFDRAGFVFSVEAVKPILTFPS